MSARDFGRSLERLLFDVGIGPLDDHVVFGSAVMKLHGLREQIGDVDVFVSPACYARLRARERWTELRPRAGDPPYLEGYGDAPCILPAAVHAFFAWTFRDEWMDVPATFAARERVHGVLCAPLEHVAMHKRCALRDLETAGVAVEGSVWEKHAHDLALIEAALA